MEAFWSDFISLATKPGIWAFTLYCFGLGTIVVGADYLSYLVNRLSAIGDEIILSRLQMNYGNTKGRLQSFLLWALGSALIGYLSGMAELVAHSFSGAFLVCTTWPLLFSKIIETNRLKLEKEGH